MSFLNAVLLALLESPAPATGGPYGLALTGVSEPTDTMAAQAATSRQSYPQRESSYQTPQSNSPASGRRSPQTDAHGRPVHGMPPMAQQMYYPQYQIPQQSSYAQRPPTSQHTSMTSAPGKMMPHQQAQQPPTHQPPQHQPPSMIDMKAQPPSSQRPPSVVGGPQSAPSTSSRPTPGPIPATTPLVLRQDKNGVQLIAFEYSRDRVKTEYTIRCDIESVNVHEISEEFKSNNCVYPRACCRKDTYKGNRLYYESECNAVGWALAQLNPCLREKRGLVQRAVDSWRNSNQDVRVRSRRVRRMAKIQNRRATQKLSGGPLSGPSGPTSAGLPPQGIPPRIPPPEPDCLPLIHHHADEPAVGRPDVSGEGYHSLPQRPLTRNPGHHRRTTTST
ncbi:hypothetical protein D0862_09547 [Hortaea werneckii]|uniref:DUF8032 domain-containing protein n=1 Tax=Hortaea werneckii TaxID=91943 RepID=A0A3M7FTF9_HORWE|nr:hypothetical protein D0862_09547 [Hortaea werneckii]